MGSSFYFLKDFKGTASGRKSGPIAQEYKKLLFIKKLSSAAEFDSHGNN